MNKIFSLTISILLSICIFSHDDIQKGYHFTENLGQLSSNVIFQCKLNTGNLFLEKDRFTFDFYSANELDSISNIKHSSREKKNGIPELTKRDRSNPLIPEKQVFKKHSYSMVFEGANPNPIIDANQKLQGYKNYFIGNDESNWAYAAKSFKNVVYNNLYNNIDMEIYSQFEYMKYDFTVHPGGNVENILINYDGVNGLEVKDGNLIIDLSTGKIKEVKLSAYQNINGERINVPCKFNIIGNNVKFEFPNSYDKNEKLIIDPIWVFSTLSGSTTDNWGFTATYDTLGNLYAAGITFGNGYPATVGSYSTSMALGGDFDISITKFNPAGTAVIYATYLGGDDNEMPHSLVHDSQNNLVLLGTSSSTNYPFTSGVYDQTFNSGWTAVYANMWGSIYNNSCDIVISKLDNQGALIASTYIGGSDDTDGLNQSMVYNYSDQVRGEIALDANDNVYVTASVWSDDFPVTNGSIINNGAGWGTQDAVVFKMNSSLSSLLWSTYLGGTDYDAGYSIRVSSRGKVFVCGGTTSNDIGATTGVIDQTFNGVWDGFIASFDANSGNPLARTYIGTTSYDQTYIIELDDQEDVYVVGQTLGNYPVINAPYSVANSAQFIHKLSSDLTTTIYSTIFGNGSLVSGIPSVNISPTAFLVDNCGNVYVSGWGGGFNSAVSTFPNGSPGPYNPYAGGNNNGMPITNSTAQQPTTDGSDFYFFVMERDATGLLYGTYFGDNTTAEHTDGGTSRFDPEGVVYQSVCAACNTGLFPSTPGVAYPTSGTAGQTSLCNMGAIKFEFDFQGVLADAVQPGNITLCSNPYVVNFSAGANPPSQAFWDFGDGNTSATVNPSHTYADTGTYQIMFVAIEPSSCNYSDTSYFSVNLIAAQQFSAQLNIPPPNPCDDTMFVNLQFTGTAADSIVWDMGDGTIIINDTLFSYYYTVPGSYTISMTAWDFTCNNTGNVSQIVNFNPTYSYANATAPPNVMLCDPPFDVTFSSTSGTPDVFWDFGDGNTSTLANLIHTYADTGTYQVMYIAIDSTTCNIADTAYFTVDLDQAQQFSAQLNIPPPNPCDDTMFVNLQFTGTAADSIVWDMGDGTIIINDTLFSYYYTVPGSYTISMTAWDFTCNNTGNVSQIVNFNPTYSYANATAPPNVMLCDPPFDVTFSSTSGTPDVFWDFGDGNTSTLANLIHTYADTGIYQVMYIAIDSTTCNIADTAYFTVDLDQAEQFSATMNIVPPDPCEDSMLVSLAFTGTGADSIIWDMGNGIVFYDTTNVDYYYTVQGTYIISMIAYDLTCNHVDTITDTAVFISNFSYANATAPPNVMLCDPPFDVDFSSSSGTPYVFWDFGDGVGTSTLDSLTYTYADTGTYQVMYVAIDSTTCNISDTAYFTVDLDQAEQLSAEFDIPVIDPCTDTSQMLVELLFTGTAADSIVWDMGDGTVFYDSTSISYLYTTQGIYIISMTAWDFTCNNIDTLIDTVEFYVSYSQANANASPNILACDPPYDVTFNSGAPSPPHSFWDFADGDTSILHNPIHTFTDTGYYNIMYIATDSSTCNIADTVYLSVEIRLSENFSAELDFVPPPPCGSDSMLVEMAFTGSGADSLIWDMGNGILFNDSALSYYYTVPGYYTVSLTAFDTLCNKVETIDETVYYAGNFQSEYIVPNIFTPNGDGENDRLVFINANDTKEFSISIFNRWGGLVYQSDNANIAWDGRSPAGKEENEGIFYFELKYTDKCSDQEIFETGFVHLIR